MEHLFSLFYQTSGVCTDTRNISADSFFIGLKGDNFDGSLFAEKAIALGAKFAVVQDQTQVDNQKIFYVENTLYFLQQLANHHRLKFNIPIIGITGSNGKTTTKELMASVLTQSFVVHFTKGNLNNHIGVPLTLLQLDNSFDMAIIEMGASKPGDIKELVEIAEPTHGVITNIGLAHLEGFGGPEGVLKTKCELYDFLAKIGGTIFVNTGEDKLIAAIPDNVEVIFYGEKDSAFVYGSCISLNPHLSINWKQQKNEDYSVDTHLIGAYNLSNILTAICVGIYFDMSPTAVNKGVSSYIPTNNRSQIQKTMNNTLILDAYNANPTSVKAAIANMVVMNAKNKLLILGDMLELGDLSESAHEEIVNIVNDEGLSVIFVGQNFMSLAKKFERNMFFETTEAAKAFLEIGKPKDNFILLKGSRAIGLEQLVDSL